jgi:LDH2 family malate/lactate/ureidoglycolate dehydrogenase
MDEVRVDPALLKRFIGEVLLAAGVDPREAPIIADVFVWFDLIGRHAQGVERLPVYLKRLELGLIVSPCYPELVRKSDAIYLLNGNDGFGHYLGHVAMSRAIDIAAERGVGVVGVCDSNHFGAGAYYAQLAAARLQLGLAVSNDAPRIAPPGGVEPVLGANPFAFGAPLRAGLSVLVDSSVDADSGSTITSTATQPASAPQATGLPFGGAKAFGPGLMIEILSGVITGSAISHEIAALDENFERSSKVGHLFIALDVSRFMPVKDYFDRMDTLLGLIRASARQAGVDAILIPGETRWRNYTQQSAEGISLALAAIKPLTILARDLGLRTPW